MNSETPSSRSQSGQDILRRSSQASDLSSDQGKTEDREDPDSDAYLRLQGLFLEAVSASQAGKVQEAVERFKAVLRVDPRLPEPRLELAVLSLRLGELEEAEAQAREGLAQLERGWRWLESFSEEELLAHACNLLGEILLERSSADLALQGDAGETRALWLEAGGLFQRAVGLDPDNPDAQRNAQSFRRQKLRGAGPKP